MTERDLLPQALFGPKGSLGDPRVVETLRWLIANKDKDINHYAAYAAEIVRLGPELLERALAPQDEDPGYVLTHVDPSSPTEGWVRDPALASRPQPHKATGEQIKKARTAWENYFTKLIGSPIRDAEVVLDGAFAAAIEAAVEEKT